MSDNIIPANQLCMLRVFNDGTVTIQEGSQSTFILDGMNYAFSELNNKRVNLEEMLRILAAKNSTQSIIVPPNCRSIITDRDRVYFTFVIPSFKGIMKIDWQDSEGLTRVDYGLSKSDAVIDYKGKRGAKREIFSFDMKYPASCIIVSTIRTESKDVGTMYHFDNCYCFAIKNDLEPLSTMKLYHWPFCNMYSSDAVCIGDIPKDYTIDSIGSVPAAIYNGVNNRDLEGTWKQNLNFTAAANVLPSNLVLAGTDNSYSFLINASQKLGYIPSQYLKLSNDYVSFIEGLSGVKL